MLRLHLYLRDPRVIEFVKGLAPRQRSRMVEQMILRAMDGSERYGEYDDLPRRVAEEVVRWLKEHGLVGVVPKSGSSPDVTVGEDVPHNAVTSFLQRWDDE